MPSHTPTVFVVEGNPAQRAGLTALMAQAGWKPVAFTSASEFLARPSLAVPGCLVLELDAADAENVEMVRRVAVERPHTPTIVTSDRADIPLTVRAIRAGAVEFLVKPLVETELLAVVGDALARSEAVLQKESALLALRRRYDSLSSRERQVMAKVVAGLLNKQVGAALGISEITVKAHRGKVMRKMGADSLAALVGMALQLQLPPAPPAEPTVFRWTGPARHGPVSPYLRASGE
jgi:FixJ family two-component response regulator